MASKIRTKSSWNEVRKKGSDLLSGALITVKYVLQNMMCETNSIVNNTY